MPWLPTCRSSFKPWGRASSCFMVSQGRPEAERLRVAARKLLFLHPRDWLLLLQAQIAILRARSVVQQRPQGDLVRDLAEEGPEISLDKHPGNDLARVEAVGLAIDRVARFGLGRPLCLVRSIALHDLLVKKGIEGSRIRVGVRMNGPRFEAHAWVEWRGSVIAEVP